MRARDTLAYAVRALTGYPARTGLTLLAMAIGVVAVILLTALGEGARRYVGDQFSQLGTHLLIVLPGRNETTGGPPPMLGETPRDLTLQDALALRRSRHIRRIAPIMVGSAPVSHGDLEREVTVLGSTAALLPIRHLHLGQGRFLPAGDASRATAVVVLGGKLKQELFGHRNALGSWVRVGDRRFRVVGVLARSGQSLGLDLGDIAIVPVASAQALFNSPALFRILVQAQHPGAVEAARTAIGDIVRRRHDGEDDVTVITQDALRTTFDGILRILTRALGGIAAISLLVAGVLIMNVMLVSVSQRTAEIGLLKALGASRRRILRLFLVESTLLASAGALLGMAASTLSLLALQRVFPAFPLAVPTWAPGAALAVSLGSGLLFGLLPARRASRLDPVQALSGR